MGRSPIFGRDYTTSSLSWDHARRFILHGRHLFSHRIGLLGITPPGYRRERLWRCPYANVASWPVGELCAKGGFSWNHAGAGICASSSELAAQPAAQPAAQQLRCSSLVVRLTLRAF